MSRNLITGGLGWLGFHLARELARQGEEVVVFDAVLNPERQKAIKGKVKFIQGDVGNWTDFFDAVKSNQVDCIYHLAALLTVPAEESKLAAYWKVNGDGFFNALEAARQCKVSHFLFPSSMGTFGISESPTVTDDSAQKPAAIYGVLKAFGERLGEYYHRRYGVNFRSIRIPGGIGLGRRGGTIDYLSLIIEEPVRGKPYVVPVGEASQLPILYFKDAIHALQSLKNADEKRLTRRVYNVQSYSASTGEMADAVRRHIPGAHIEFHPVEATARLVDKWPKAMDDSNARRDWGWQPQFDLDKTVLDFIAEVKAEK